MTNFAARVQIPKRGTINSGLSYCRPQTAVEIFGMPADQLPINCGTPTSPRLKAALLTESVGPFRVTGLKPAVASL
ncbi:hypothetical protein [Deinococcus irradiatisoli]|uniref:hypothetical protein n=1 Tax=Deinococcus irradiatisoli TaxID=2202254 RepID=UPI0011B20A8E|nr:hypothetical protein [Deinococcus irradiatisoli]